MMALIKTCGREILANFLMGFPPIARRRIRAGRTSTHADCEQLRRYAFGLILDNPAIQPLIPGAHVLEIGPGDHLATGLAFLAYGAASYTALDRFAGDYRSTSARAWYALVRSQWAHYFPARAWPEGLNDFPDLARVHYIDAAIEDIERLPSGAYDLVVSQAVGEHVQSIDDFAHGTARLLHRSGVALHNVDFSCHGFFPDEPLRFLTIPAPIWHLMGSHRGLPNRKRMHDFETAFSAAGLTAQVLSRSMMQTRIPQGLGGLPQDSLLTHWASFLLHKAKSGSRYS